jgi:hypothetical protein
MFLTVFEVVRHLTQSTPGFPRPNRIIIFVLMFSPVYKQGFSQKILLLKSVSSFPPFVLHVLHTSSPFIEPPVIITSVMLTVKKFYC